jgi:hypothetical protein
MGQKNIIIGNNNVVAGSNNYIFSTDFSTLSNAKAKPSGTLNHALVSDNWIAELDKK